jgi:hypothetical protein
VRVHVRRLNLQRSELGDRDEVPVRACAREPVRCVRALRGDPDVLLDREAEAVQDRPLATGANVEPQLEPLGRPGSLILRSASAIFIVTPLID